ncbi:hypothetical protein BU26DRAFT_572788 [Trematosphaeria pertusa]|uniref:Clr5 domain-containing protein n=1 Tax=Trematosphaeria pertusa TaxID=390896 RepID=A0A6A6HQJ0_9PLEO|nr:uncharacterized protein BU26DRAFT_572788 [Trematosphaeria pertusa]KAF2240405.1 hypothetical protein BU26DRAFT_572788 [Trematosphaeria pertusa]
MSLHQCRRRRIPDEEWESHKLRIKRLFLEKTLEGDDGLISTMEKECGFSARQITSTFFLARRALIQFTVRRSTRQGSRGGVSESTLAKNNGTRSITLWIIAMRKAKEVKYTYTESHSRRRR